MFKKTGILFLAILLSGCATLGQPLSQEYRQSLRNITVVSVMGDTFNGVKIGTTVLNNEQFEEDFSVFGMDRKIQESVASYLKDHSKINASIKPDLKKEFQDVFKYGSNQSYALDSLKSTLANLKAEGIDAVLVISQNEDSFEDAGIWIHGYGLVVRSFLMMWYAKAFFVAKFTLIDTSTQKVAFEHTGFWWKEIKFSKWQKSFLDFTESEQNATKEFLTSVLSSDIRKFLEKSNF
jgi:hypothetical protein